MTDSTNMPMLADMESPTQGAFPVWSKVYTRPNEQTFIEISEHPEAKAKAAYIWVFLAGTLAALINSLIQFIVAMVGLRQMLPQVGELPGGAGRLVGITGLLTAVCSAPLAGLFSVLGFILGVAVIHATARFFGGQGTFDRLAYAFGAVVAPYTLVTALLAPFNIIPFAAFGIVPVLLMLGIYVLFLQLTAVKAVHRFGWGEAAAAFFMPGILIGLLCGVTFLLTLRMVGPSLMNVFQQIQQGIPHP